VTVSVPLVARRMAYLVLGGALLLPFGVLAVLVAALVPDLGTRYLADVVVLTAVLLLALPGFGLLDPVQSLELTAARELLPTPPLPPGPRTGTARRRVAAWFAVHVVLGAVGSCLLLTVPLTLVSLGQWAGPDHRAPVWAPAAALGGLLGAPLAAVVAGAGLARWAPGALGPSAQERVALLEARARGLTRRQELAREVHDSVGHALSVVSLQAAAADHVFDRDPDFARSALRAVADTARTALDELDRVLGLLADDEAEVSVPVGTVQTLVERTRSTGVEVTADLADVPETLHADVFRIVQEGLTNAVRHGGGRVEVRVAEASGQLEIEVRNPLGPAGTRGSGRGLAGLTRRVEARGGTVSSGPVHGYWLLTVRLPR
jgi:signal transduction histidine kinase